MCSVVSVICGSEPMNASASWTKDISFVDIGIKATVDGLPVSAKVFAVSLTLVIPHPLHKVLVEGVKA